MMGEQPEISNPVAHHQGGEEFFPVTQIGRGGSTFFTCARLGGTLRLAGFMH